MAINIALEPRREVELEGQPIPRIFVGYDPKQPDAILWDANRGVYQLDERAGEEKFATFSHEGTIRLVAELEGIEQFDVEGEKLGALMGRILVQGDPVRDALVGRQVEAVDTVSHIDTTELDEMPAAERYAGQIGARRTFLLTLSADQWVWTPEDEQEIITRTAAGAPWREPWSAGGRRQGIKPGDRIFLLQNGAERGIRASGVVSSHIYQAEHWDDPRRVANYIDIDWDMMLPVERMINIHTLSQQVPGFGWRLQRGGVELHEPMAGQLEKLWGEHLGDDSPTIVPRDPGWDLDDPRRRAVSRAALRRAAETLAADGWEVIETHHERPYDAVATKGDEVRYVFARGIETAGRPIHFTADEVTHLRASVGSCLLALLSDVQFTHHGGIEPESGVFSLELADIDDEGLAPVLYIWQRGQRSDERRADL